MHYLIAFLILCLSSCQTVAQSLLQASKTIRPELFINNIQNKRVFQQTAMNANYLIFARGFEDRNIEEIQQSFHYFNLDEKLGNWVLELQLDRHPLPIDTDYMDLASGGYHDFGIRIYHKTAEPNNWEEKTLDALPKDFVMRLMQQFEVLQQGGMGLYFYNQSAEEEVQVLFEKKQLRFKQAGEVVLSLTWKRAGFTWK